ncbi:MAG TPA: DNA replication and repair protein RecF [Candidatus Acidoferrum sp.]|nr:DNA replication and repair protein RecF [Candidatus Acidoferrum sp.]
MQIGWIQLVDFRNYHTLSYTPSAPLNLLTGANAQGKSNLLEALAVLLTGRSFRTSRLAEIPRWGAETTSLAGELRRTDGARTVRRGLRKREDGVWQGAGEECPWARVVTFGWQDLEIVNGMPAVRRNFLDGFAARLYPSHRAVFVRFRQVLARRNHLLQQRLPDRTLTARMAPWDEQFAVVGMEMIDRRRRAAAALQTEIARVYPTLVGDRRALSGEHEKVEIRYRSSVGEATGPEALMAALERVRTEEARRGQTLVGPHRDDLAIELGGVDARAFGSRGQQRLLALSLRLAEILPITEAVGTAPLLLLDDALSELDAEVRHHVLREIRASDQVFLTTADALDVPGAARWIITKGEIAAA